MKKLFTKLLTIVSVIVIGTNVAMADVFDFVNATYSSSSKGYEVENVGAYFKSTSGGTTAISDDDAVTGDFADFTKYATTSSSVFIFKISSATSQIKVYGKGSGNRTISKIETSLSLNGTYSEIASTDYNVSTTLSGDYLFTKNEYSVATFDFDSQISGETYIKFTLSGNINVYAIVISTVVDTESPVFGSDFQTSYNTTANVETTLTNSVSHASEYAWYSCDAEGNNPSAEPVATTKDYKFTPTTEGTLYFYCNATNPNATGTKTVKSSVVTVTVAAAPADITAISTDKLWNMSNMETGDITSETISDNLKFIASSDKKLTIEGNTKSLDDISFTKRVKTGGAGNKEQLALSFKVSGECWITVYGMSGKAGDTRNLKINDGITESNILSNDGNAIAKGVYHYAGTGEKQFWLYSGNSGFNIYGIKVSFTQPAVTVSSCGKSSFSCGKALDFTNVENVKAYMVTDETAESVTLTEIKKVPANTGIFVIGNAGTYNVPVLTGAADDASSNKLVATTEPKNVTAGDNIWGISADDGKLHPVTSGTIAAGKAYLVSTVGGSGSAKTIKIVNGDTATGISTIETAKTIANGAAYNLAGQRINANAKGIVVVNGKKVLNK